jgi:hypothetical protein
VVIAVNSVCLIIVATRIQQMTPERLRGAVSGFNAMTQSGLAGAAAAGMAFAATGLGPRTVLIAVAAITSATGLIAVSRVRKLDDHVTDPDDQPGHRTRQLDSPPWGVATIYGTAAVPVVEVALVSCVLPP